jgi:hypothetical protein
VVGVSLQSELGPVLTALLVAGRAGSATTAEIGTMVATEQLDGLRMMSVDPVHYVVVPRAVGLALVMPLLSALFITCGIAGGWLVGVMLMGLDSGRYLTSLQASTQFVKDVVGSFVKALDLRRGGRPDLHLARLPQRAHVGRRLGRDHEHGGHGFVEHPPGRLYDHRTLGREQWNARQHATRSSASSSSRACSRSPSLVAARGRLLPVRRAAPAPLRQLRRDQRPQAARAGGHRRREGGRGRAHRAGRGRLRERRAQRGRQAGTRRTARPRS